MRSNDQAGHYFDWAATSMPESPSSGDVPFGNPFSIHHEGRMAREALESARSRCAAALGVPPATVYFTSGGTESNCIPLYSCLFRKGSGRLIASVGEHPSITENVKKIERLGVPAGSIPIDSSGRVTPSFFSKTLEKFNDVRFAAIMLVNNETGAVNDIESLANMLQKSNFPPMHLHCDMVQALGKIPLDISAWKIDSASFSAHKIGGPRGIGILYLRKPVEALYAGGGQEGNMRPGTENVAGALAMADCIERHAIPEKLAAENAAAGCRMQYLISELKKIDRFQIIPRERTSDDRGFSPYILQAAFKGVPGEVMVRALDDLGFAVSTGSACSSASAKRPVLAAMGIPDNMSMEGIRISQGWSTTESEFSLLISAIKEVLQFL